MRLCFSEKQKRVLRWWNRGSPDAGKDAILCDGAVRSGKTLCLGLSFVLWSMTRFQRQQFALCGKTTESVRRNLLSSVLPVLEGLGFTWEEKLSRNWMKIRCGGVENTYFLFGGKDEGSAALIQGVTLAGVLLDEVALMPRSFVEQALTRCSVDGAKLWFSCNPESPQHWFYLEWIKRHKERNALYLHFEMTDNPGLSAKTIERYQSMFTGVFYDRYIRGLWVLAEGLVYDFFGEEQIVDEVPGKGEYYISCDYGTLNPFSAGLWCWDGKMATRVREYYYSGRENQRNKTDEEYYTDLEALAGDLPVRAAVVDPSAASFIETIRRHGRLKVRKAHNEVVPGIMTTARMLRDGTVKIHRSCKDAIREFGLYRWDDKAAEDRPVKENDHAMDDIRYFCQTILRHKAGKPEYVPLYKRR